MNTSAYKKNDPLNDDKNSSAIWLTRLCHWRLPSYLTVLEILWLFIIFSIPIYFNPLTHFEFYLNKELLIRSISSFMLITVICHWLWKGNGAINWRQILLSTPLSWTILVFGLIFSLATIFSISPMFSFWGSLARAEGWVTMASWIVFYYIAAYYLRQPAQIIRAIGVLILSSALVSIGGILQAYLPDVMAHVFMADSGGRVFSTTGNALSLSTFLSMAIPFTLAFTGYIWGRKDIFLKFRLQVILGLVIILALQFWCLALAQYSITILVFLISLMAFFLLWAYVRRQRLILMVSGILGTILIIASAIIVIPLLTANNDNNTNSNSAVSAESIGLRTLRNGRIHFWQHTIDLWWQSPVIPGSKVYPEFLRKVIGYGPENYLPLIQQDYPKTQASIADTGMDSTTAILHRNFMEHPHNQYLYWLTTTGACGLAAYLAILITFGLLAYRIIRRNNLCTNLWFTLSAIAAMVQYSADMIFNPATPSGEVMFWFCLVLLSVVYLEDKNNIVRLPDKLIQKIKLNRKVLSVLTGAILLSCILIPTSSQFRADVSYQNALDDIDNENPSSIFTINKTVQIQPQEPFYWGTRGTYVFQTALRNSESEYFNDLMSFSISSLDKAIECQPYVFYYYYFQAEVYRYWALQGATKHWEDVYKDYQQADALFPNNAIIQAKWALALYAGGYPDEAKDRLREAFQDDPNWAQKSATFPGDFTYYYCFSTEMAMVNSYTSIQSSLSEETAPPDWLIHVWRGVAAYANTSDYKVFLTEFNEAVQDAPISTARSLKVYLFDMMQRSSGYLFYWGLSPRIMANP